MCMLTAVLAAMLTFAMNVALAQEKFDLGWTTADQGGITLAIDTTLPDNAEIRMSASRTYYRATSNGKTDTYSHEYFREDGQVSQWRTLRQIPTDDAVWVEELRAHMDELAKLGTEMAFEIDSIDSHIEVTAYAYAHKSGERFGAREYESLLAKIQDTELVGKSEIRVMRPLLNSADIPKRSMMVGWNELEIGHSYRLIGDRTPLMDYPELQGGTEQKLEQLAQTLYLPSGTVIQVTGFGSANGTQWHHVVLPGHSGREGWINSIALMSDGVYRLSNEQSQQVSAAVDYRAEITAEIIDPCLLAIVRRTEELESLPEAQAVELVKMLQSETWETMIDAVLPVVSGKSPEARAAFYRVALQQCIASSPTGRVGGGIAAPRPSQSRACAIDALGSSPDRFAQEALMLPRLFGYPLLFRVRVGGTQSVLQRFPSVVLYR